MKISLNVQIFIGTLLGVVGGLLLSRISEYSSLYLSVIYVCDIASSVFIGLLKMILIPLIFTSIAVGIANLRAHHQMKQVWVYTLAYFLFTAAFAAVLGLVAMNVFQPGKGLEVAPFKDAMESFHADQITVGQFLRAYIANLFMNPFSAMAKGDVLATVVFAFFLGIAMVALGKRTETLQNVLNQIFEAIMVMVEWIMRLAPVGIMALLIKLVAVQDVSLLSALGTFIVVVMATTLFHGFIVLPAILYALTKIHPFFFFNGFKEALITAFATSSSNATLPVSMRCAKENLKIKSEIAGFVFPLGATVNMDGTALYEAGAALFVANIAGIELNLVQQAIVVLTAVIASIGAPGIPSAGMVTMVMVLQAVGLPLEAIAILLPIDRILDTVRTMVNVEGDCVASLVVQNLVERPR